MTIRLHGRPRRPVQLFLAVAVASLLLGGTSGVAFADGAALFQANCAGCHGGEGKADTPMAKAMKVPALSGTKLTAEQIVQHVREAKSHATPSNALSDEDLAQVAAAVKAL